MYYMNDKKTFDQMKLPIPKLFKHAAMKKIEGTWIEELLKEQKLL